MIQTISIIHPSRQRVAQALQTARKWLQNSTQPKSNIEYILSIDITDPHLESYKQIFKDALPFIKIIINDNFTAIDAVNHAAKSSTGDLLILVSDDFDCPHNWDTFLIDYLKDKEDFVVKTDDGVQDWIITIPIMDRKYYERFGYMYYPEYQHMFCDTEMTHVGDLLNRKIVAPIRFIHNHYTTGVVPKDSINVKNDNTWNQGKKLYLERMKRDFDLKDCPGKLSCGPSHIQWLKNEGVNI